MKLETTTEILSAILTRAELIDISNHIGEASLNYMRDGLKASAEWAWKIREMFMQASKKANERHEGQLYRW